MWVYRIAYVSLHPKSLNEKLRADLDSTVVITVSSQIMFDPVEEISNMTTFWKAQAVIYWIPAWLFYISIGVKVIIGNSRLFVYCCM